MSPKRAGSEPPAMNTQSKRSRPSGVPQLRDKLVELDAVDEDHSVEVGAPSTALKMALNNKCSSNYPEKQTLSKDLTSRQAPKWMVARISMSKAASSRRDSMSIEGVPLLKTATEVSSFWYEECQKVFSLKKGYEIDMYADEENAMSQQIVVWEKEAYDKVLLQRPGSPILTELSNSKRTEEDWRRDLNKNTIQPPETMKEYERFAQSITRDIPIFVVECRGADMDRESEWRNPTPQDISRSYAHPPCSEIQQALTDYIYKFDAEINYDPRLGWLTQEQCFCATAVGDKVKFWKHVSPYPHLKLWSEVLDVTKEEKTFRRVVGQKLAEVEEDGYQFAMEFDGRETFAD